MGVEKSPLNKNKNKIIPQLVNLCEFQNWELGVPEFKYFESRVQNTGTIGGEDL